ncbi:hypothetical protein [Xaviernesmea oryzae]|uniref:hypothetical protein n=1 Tax=Xaviernesmea oryzae TaxID=464029 RepID=UPI00117BBF99|nr:hypothetical protein [Xaviernesmea oryzae]
MEDMIRFPLNDRFRKPGDSRFPLRVPLTDSEAYCRKYEDASNPAELLFAISAHLNRTEEGAEFA